MRLVPGSELVRQSLAAHSWMGLLAGALMYLICLSGTLAVFYPELERWEQPGVVETTHYDTAAVSRAYQALTETTPVTHHMYVGLPTAEMPRFYVASEEGGRFVAADGSLAEPVRHDWTHLLIDLHLYLHLPESFGMIVVSALGALLCGLIVSGLMAHPRLVKDAFLLRLGGSRHLEQADIHNRLSVWGAPFHLMIGVTGAYFGLAALVSLVLAAAYFDGDRQAVMASAFGAEPALEQPTGPPALATALERMRQIAPGAEPFFVTVEEAGTPAQYVVVSARHPGRMIWAEQYRFDSAGNYIDKLGYSDGAAGRQALFSVYRLHFGHFGGLPVKVLYGVLGLALTVVAVTGINVWLARRRRRDFLNPLWTGLVWGAPAGLALSALVQVVLDVAWPGPLWGGIAAAMAWAWRRDDETLARRDLLGAGSALLVALLGAHLVRYGADAVTGAAAWVNLALAATAAALFWMGRGARSGSAYPAPASP